MTTPAAAWPGLPRDAPSVRRINVSCRFTRLLPLPGSLYVEDAPTIIAGHQLRGGAGMAQRRRIDAHAAGVAGAAGNAADRAASPAAADCLVAGEDVGWAVGCGALAPGAQ